MKKIERTKFSQIHRGTGQRRIRYCTKTSEHFTFLPDIVKGYILHDLTECGVEGLEIMISGLKCEPTYLMKSILPTSIIYIMDMGKLDKAIDIFKSKGWITNNDLHMISYACIAQIVWEKQPKLNSKITFALY